MRHTVAVLLCAAALTACGTPKAVKPGSASQVCSGR